MAAGRRCPDSPNAHLTDDFDQLRWFELPAGTLAD